MTQITNMDKIRSRDVARPPTSDSSDSKSPTGSAMLAQQLGSESSWADRYVPGTPSETIMTPESSIADHGEQRLEGEYMTPNEAPPSYEEVTSSGAPSQSPSQPQGQSRSSRPQSQLPQRPPLPGRHYSRHETHQSINGTFTLYDSLNLTTTSGSINIKLDVQPGSEPARLNLKTNSGSINLNDTQCDIAKGHSADSHRSISRSGNTGGSGLLSFLWGSRNCPSNTQTEAPPIPTSDDPRKQRGQHLQQQVDPAATTSSTSGARVILTTIETSSGSVNSQLILTPTSSTTIKTVSGSIHPRFITSDSSSSSRSLSKLEAEDSRLHSTRDLTSTVSTTSGSGSQNIKITTGITDTSGGAIVSALRAHHHSTGSASVHVDYPREWEGLVHASVGGSGSVNVRGEGLEFDRRGNKEVWAWRGSDLPDVEGAIQVRCDGSGTVNFSC